MRGQQFGRNRNFIGQAAFRNRQDNKYKNNNQVQYEDELYTTGYIQSNYHNNYDNYNNYDDDINPDYDDLVYDDYHESIMITNMIITIDMMMMNMITKVITDMMM